MPGQGVWILFYRLWDKTQLEPCFGENPLSRIDFRGTGKMRWRVRVRDKNSSGKEAGGNLGHFEGIKSSCFIICQFLGWDYEKDVPGDRPGLRNAVNKR